MSAFFNFEHTLNRLFNNCIKLCWYQISSSGNMKQVGELNLPTPEKNYPQKAQLYYSSRE